MVTTDVVYSQSAFLDALNTKESFKLFKNELKTQCENRNPRWTNLSSPDTTQKFTLVSAILSVVRNIVALIETTFKLIGASFTRSNILEMTKFSYLVDFKDTLMDFIQTLSFKNLTKFGSSLSVFAETTGLLCEASSGAANLAGQQKIAEVCSKAGTCLSHISTAFSIASLISGFEELQNLDALEKNLPQKKSREIFAARFAAIRHEKRVDFANSLVYFTAALAAFSTLGPIAATVTPLYATGSFVSFYKHTKQISADRQFKEAFSALYSVT